MKANGNPIKIPAFLILTGILHILFFNVSAQQGTLESQRKFSTTKLLKDSTSILKYIEEAKLLQESYTDSAIKKINFALQSSLAIKYKRGVRRSLSELSFLYHISNEHLKSILALQSALNYLDTGKAGYIMTVDIYTAIAYRHMFIGNSDSAAYYYYKALDEIERGKVDNPNVLINTYSSIILYWVNLGDDLQAMNPEDKYAKTVITYLNKAELLENKNNKALGKIILSKGYLNFILHKFDSARYHYHRYLTIANDTEANYYQKSQITATYANIAQTFLSENKPDSAIFYSEKVIRKFETDGKKDSNLLIFAGYNLGEAYNLQRKYKEAIRATVPALQIARTHSLSSQLSGHKILSSAYSAIGDYRSAWEEQKAYSLVKDSMKKLENIRTISQMEVKYQVAERNKELAEKEMAIALRDSSIKTKNMWIGGIFASIILLMLTGILLYRQHLQKQRIQLLQMQQEKEVSLLHAMIDGEEKERKRLAVELHDGIGGLLGTIRMQLGAALRSRSSATGNEGFKEILSLLDDAYSELRKTAHNLMPEILDQEGLEIAIGMFCDRIRKADNIEIIFETVGTIPRLKPRLELALYRIVQELLHNIMKHAQASEAIVQLAFINDRLGITVEDNGKGMGSIVNNGSLAGMGIKTIQDRINGIGGKFDIFSSPGEGSSINLELLITAKEKLRD